MYISRLKEEMWEAHRATARYIRANNIKKIKDESPEIQEEFKRLEKVYGEKMKFLHEELKRMHKEWQKCCLTCGQLKTDCKCIIIPI